MNRRTRIALVMIGTGIGSWPALGLANNLLVHPTRIQLSDQERTAQVDITNTGREPSVYRITLENKRMTENGEFVRVTETKHGDPFATELLRYSPRQVELAPGAGQTIRIQARVPADLAAGEYRSHLVFTRVPTAATNNIEKKEAELEGNQIGIVLKPLIGVSIPVLVRHGETSVSGRISGLKVQPATKQDPAVLTLNLERSGNRSLYGDLAVTFVPQGASAGTQVGAASGVAVYTPNPLRIVKLALHPEGNTKLAKGTLQVTLKEPKNAGGKLLSEATLELP